MATPFVSGAAALVLAAHGGGLSAAQLREALLTSASAAPAAAGRTSSGGVLNVAAALQRALGLPASVPEASPSPSPKATTYVWQIKWVACAKAGVNGCRRRCVTATKAGKKVQQCALQRPVRVRVAAKKASRKMLAV